MGLAAYRLLMVLCLGWGVAVHSSAATSWPFGGAHFYPAWAGVLALLASLVLLWRRRRLRGELGNVQRQLAGEYGLRASAEQTLSDLRARLSRLVASQDTILEDERRRIARDIHDDLGQNLLALKIDLSLLQTGSPELPPRAAEKLVQIASHLDLTIKSLRHIINDLHPVALSGGLKAAIERQLSEFSRINGIAHHFEAGPDVFGAGEHVDTIIYRILQESLSNIARHARASAARVVLTRKDGVLYMSVSDNGVGLPQHARQRGSGLQGIEDRINAAGGKFDACSAPGEGTTLSLSIPIGEAAAGRQYPGTASTPMPMPTSGLPKH